jgi:NAD+ synthase (glutamine-hydrolysing)
MAGSIPRSDFFNLYRHGFARVAVATPLVRIGNPAQNLAGTLALLREAMKEKAVLAVFPELGLSAYTCARRADRALASDADRGAGGPAGAARGQPL